MPGRQGSSCASLCGGPAGGHNCASVGGPSSRSVCPDAARWDGPAGGGVVVRLVSGPGGGARKTRPPAARKRRPGGAYPVALRFGRRGSRCAPRQWSGRRRPQNSSARGPEKATQWGFPGDAVARQAGESLCASSVVREAAPAKLVRPRPGKGDPVGLTRWRCGSAGGGVITCPSVARQGSSKGRPGGEMQSGTSARHYLFARGPAKAARQRQPGEGGPEGFTRWRCGPRVEE